MATFVPFAILRMIPAVEAGAVAHLDGLRERGTAAMTRLPRTAASHALHEGSGGAGRRDGCWRETAAAGGARWQAGGGGRPGRRAAAGVAAAMTGADARVAAGDAKA